MSTEPATKRVSIREAVAESVSNVGERTRNQVVEAFAQREADKRATALVKALDKLTELEREGYKLKKPDIVSFNEDGSPKDSAYSQERVKAIKEHGEKLEKLTNAINAADDKGDFSKLYDLVK